MLQVSLLMGCRCQGKCQCVVCEDFDVYALKFNGCVVRNGVSYGCRTQVGTEGRFEANFKLCAFVFSILEALYVHCPGLKRVLYTRRLYSTIRSRV